MVSFRKVWVGFLSSHHGNNIVQEVLENLLDKGTDDNEAHGQAYSEITKDFSMSVAPSSPLYLPSSLFPPFSAGPRVSFHIRVVFSEPV